MSYWEASGKSDDWYTPKFVFDALGVEFDMDVAGKNIAVSQVPAERIIESNSLAETWAGMVWMNPPFGGRNAIKQWLDKFLEHGNGIALTPDRTSAPWFQDAWPKADLGMFTRKIRFVRPDGTVGVSPSNGTTLWACGEGACNALRRAADQGLGILAAPCKRQKARTK